MTDFDLERLGSLWRTEPEPEGIRELQKSARAASRRARRALVLDFILTGIAVGTVLFILAVNPNVPALIVGGLAVGVAIRGQLRQRRLRRIELQELTGDTESMINGSIARVEATLKRASSGLIVLGPAVLLGLLFGFIVERGGDALQIFDPGSWRAIVATILAVFIVLVTLAQLAVTLRRGRRELNRLLELRQAYRLEREKSFPAEKNTDNRS